nr:hypothetical protein [uncultured Halomonas sp.]
MKVADHWFARERVDDRITRLWEPHVARVFQCNIWHVRGRDGDMLIDSGMGGVSLTQWVPLVTERAVQDRQTHACRGHP